MIAQAAEIKSLRFERTERPSSAETSAGVVERAIDRGFALALAILNRPALLDRIPDGAAVVLLPPEDRALAKSNTALGDSLAHRGYSVAYWELAARAEGTVDYFTLDLRDERWGADPRHEFNGQTAAQMRDALAQAVRESQEHALDGFTFDTRVVLNGVRIRIEEEIDPGLYRSVAIDGRPA